MLNPKQRAAVTFGDGAALVLAGPGSGKTHTLCRRVHYLMTKRGVPSEKILVITFTKAAAEEMKSRHLAHCGGRSRAVFGTFHSFFFSLLKEELHLLNDDILDAKTRSFLLKKTAEELSVDTSRMPDFYGNIASEISFVKNTDIDLIEEAKEGKTEEELTGAFVPRDLSRHTFSEFFLRYEKAKDAYAKIDFDDMLLKAKKLLLTRPDILEKWQKRYRYFLVDEAQDMNSVQYELVRLLAAPANNVFFVGDDDQSVYAFRGADAGWMRTFTASFPDSTQIILDTNYRSAPAIVVASKRLINNNRLRIDKDYAAARVCAGKISYHSCATPQEEAAYVADAVYSMQKDDPQKTIAILFRSHAQSEQMIAAFKRKALSYSYQKQEDNPYDHFIYRDVSAYFALATGGRRRADVLSVMNRPNRFLPRGGLEEELVSFDEWTAYHTDAPMVVRAIREFAGQIVLMEKMSAFAAYNYLLKGMGYGEFAKEEVQKDSSFTAGESSRPEKSAACEKAFATIADIAKRYPDKKLFLRELTRLRKEEGRAGAQGNGQTGAPAPVRLLSFHGAKGLEFDLVYIIDACEGITPSKKANSEKELEEERRMFYVAATRAKDELVILTVARRGNEMLYPSRFIKEMAEEAPE